MSPKSEEASKMEGAPKMKVAVPFVPSLERVSFTSGVEGSSTPLTNCISADIHVTFLDCNLCLVAPTAKWFR